MTDSFEAIIGCGITTKLFEHSTYNAQSVFEPSSMVVCAFQLWKERNIKCSCVLYCTLYQLCIMRTAFKKSLDLLLNYGCLLLVGLLLTDTCYFMVSVLAFNFGRPDADDGQLGPSQLDVRRRWGQVARSDRRHRPVVRSLTVSESQRTDRIWWTRWLRPFRLLLSHL